VRVGSQRFYLDILTPYILRDDRNRVDTRRSSPYYIADLDDNHCQATRRLNTLRCTKSKGIAYQLDVAKVVKAELVHGNLGLDPAQAKVHYKPSYFSRDRKKDIVFDVSVEVRRKGASEPYWVWVWECKNYNHSVPVDDVEEFHAKLEQVGADRTKGTMITPIGYDKGSIEYARSKGIGLWRYIPQGSLVCFMEDSRDVADGDILCAITMPETSKFRYYGDFYGLTCSGKLTTDRGELIQAELKDALESTPNNAQQQWGKHRPSIR